MSTTKKRTVGRIVHFFPVVLSGNAGDSAEGHAPLAAIIVALGVGRIDLVGFDMGGAIFYEEKVTESLGPRQGMWMWPPREDLDS